MNNNIVQIVNTQFGLQANDTNFMQLLADNINKLIVNNFDKLISILYRADIDEKKLNTLLQQNKNEDAGKLIAALFVQRHVEKAASRAKFKNKNSNFFDEEKW